MADNFWGDGKPDSAMAVPIQGALPVASLGSSGAFDICTLRVDASSGGRPAYPRPAARQGTF